MDQSLRFYSLNVFQPDATPTNDFEIRTTTFRALNVAVSDLRNKMDGFSGGFIEFSKTKLPCGAANPTLKR